MISKNEEKHYYCYHNNSASRLNVIGLFVAISFFFYFITKDIIVFLYINNYYVWLFLLLSFIVFCICATVRNYCRNLLILITEQDILIEVIHIFSAKKRLLIPIGDIKHICSDFEGKNKYLLLKNDTTVNFVELPDEFYDYLHKVRNIKIE